MCNVATFTQGQSNRIYILPRSSLVDSDLFMPKAGGRGVANQSPHDLHCPFLFFLIIFSLASVERRESDRHARNTGSLLQKEYMVDPDHIWGSNIYFRRHSSSPCTLTSKLSNGRRKQQQQQQQPVCVVTPRQDLSWVIICMYIVWS